MENSIRIVNIRHNSIFVEWTLWNLHQNCTTQRSPPFVLTSERCSIPFFLSFNNDVSITIEHTTARTGRAIITVAVIDTNFINAMKVILTENWEKACTFKNLGRLPQNQSSYQQTSQRSQMKIICKIIWLGFVGDATVPKLPLPPLSIANAPFDNTENPDFTIIIEGQEISAHKTMLALHSPVLSAMFQTPMKESKENKLIIEDVDFSIMKVILALIYRGETDPLDDIDIALKVLEAAEKYQMSMIKSLCECKLQLKITATNVLTFLQEADKYNAAKLCETCVAYIITSKDAKMKSEFRRISQTPNIAFAVMNAFMDQLYLTPKETF